MRKRPSVAASPAAPLTQTSSIARSSPIMMRREKLVQVFWAFLASAG